VKYRLRAYSYLIIVVILWGIAGPVIKLVLNHLPPDIFLTYRFLLSTLVLIPYFVIHGLGLPRDWRLKVWLLIYAFLTSTLALGALFFGMSKTNVLDMSLISLSAPLLIMFFGYLFFRDHLTAKQKIGTLIALCGAVLIGVAPILRMDHGQSGFIGNIFVFISVIAGGFGAVILKKLIREHVSPVTLVNMTFLVGFVTMLPVVLYLHPLSYSLNLLSNLDIKYHVGVIYMALLSGNLAYLLDNMAYKTLKLSEVAPFAYLYPTLSAILAIIFLGDQLTFFIIIGTILTISGVYLVEWRRRLYN
jgi:drug/metabolite transporter (DMT)-like permease